MRVNASHCFTIAGGVLLFLALAGCATAPPGPVPTATPFPFVPWTLQFEYVAWTRQFGFPGDDGARAVAVDGSGNIIVAGYISGALSGQSSAGAEDAFVRKLSPDGIELWTRQFGSPTLDSANAVVVDGTGNVIVAGHLYGALSGQTYAGIEDAFVRKLSPEGAELWTRQFGSPGLDSANAVVVDGTGNVIVAGLTHGALPGQTSAGPVDAFVRKLSPDGAELWTHQFGSIWTERANGVAVDGSGNILVAGNTWGVLAGESDAGGQDAFVRKLSPGGDELWTRQFGSPSYDQALGVAVDGSGNIVVAGYTLGALPGQTLHGSWDAFVVRLD